MTKQPDHNPLERLLERRVSPAHLRQRLGIEREREKRIFGQGLGFFHIENWYSVHALLRGLLRLTLLHERGRRNALQLQVTRNELCLDGLPAAFDGFTILHLTDLHLDINDAIPDAVAERLHGLDYDLCVITGDFRARTYGPWDRALDATRRVRDVLRDPVYAVLGNHDSIEMVPGLEAMGIRVLLNESVALERQGQRIWLAGIDDPHYYEAHNLEKAAADIPDGATSILLSHSPEPYRHAAHVGFDAFLCGHTHGGQICLPGGFPLMLNARAPRAVCNGPWRCHGMDGYTSRGTGVSVVDVRFNCPPEMTLHTLRRRAPQAAAAG